MITYKPAGSEAQYSQYSIVIALPGLVAENEKTRMNEILGQLQQTGILGVLLPITDIEFDESKKLKICHMDMEKSAKMIGEAISEMALERKLLPTSIGLISNSISAIPATRFLINNGGIEINSYASISPMPGWNYFSSADMREKILKFGRGIPVTSPFDRKEGITRIIPPEHVAYLQGVDCLRDLAGYNQNGTDAFTVLGKRDSTSSPDAIRAYHRLLHGAPENLLEVDAEHDVPNTSKDVIDFMIKSLKSGSK